MKERTMKQQVTDFLSPTELQARHLDAWRTIPLALLTACAGWIGSTAFTNAQANPNDPAANNGQSPSRKNAPPGMSGYAKGRASPGVSVGWQPQLGAAPSGTTTTTSATSGAPMVGSTTGPTLSPGLNPSLATSPSSGGTMTSKPTYAGPYDAYGVPRYPGGSSALSKPSTSTADPARTMQAAGNMVCIGLYCERAINGTRPGVSAAKTSVSVAKTGSATVAADSATRLTEIVPSPGQWADARRESGALGAVSRASWNAPTAQPGSCVPVTLRPVAQRADQVRVDFSGDGLIQSVLLKDQVQLALVGTRYVDADMGQAQAMCVPQAVMREIARLGAPAAQASATQLKRDANGWVLSGAALVR
jgi:hypothetical protein